MHAFTSVIWMWFSRSLGFQISFKAAHIENKRCLCMFTEKIWQFKLLNCMRLSFSCKLVCVCVCVCMCVCMWHVYVCILIGSWSAIVDLSLWELWSHVLHRKVCVPFCFHVTSSLALMHACMMCTHHPVLRYYSGEFSRLSWILINCKKLNLRNCSIFTVIDNEYELYSVHVCPPT